MQTPEIELWNIRDRLVQYAGAQRIFNVVGSMKAPDVAERLTYSLNQGPESPIIIKKRGSALGQRLEREGDFNIDTISLDQLRTENELCVMAYLQNGQRLERRVNFSVYQDREERDRFRLDFQKIRWPQEVGQIVDGRWIISQGEGGKRCLELRPQDTGLDRIILFGDRRLRTEYTIKAHFCITAWTGTPHNLGLVFHWNPHLQGDGSELPSQWSTGLGYYYSHCRGLRIRVGVNVHLNSQGQKVGDYLLGEKAFSPWRFWRSMLADLVPGTRRHWTQLLPGEHYLFQLTIKRSVYALTVWKIGQEQPRPQIIVHDPPELLREGSVGIIAHRCAVRVYEFELLPTP